jgi:hypothetical protein
MFSSVINLSVITPSIPQLEVLSFGLNFCPVPHQVDILQLKEDFQRFSRNLRLREYFSNQDSSPYVPNPFKAQSTFTPSTNRCRFLDTYISAVESQIFAALEEQAPFYKNLNSAQSKALLELRSNRQIVIREADKGSGVVIMDRDRYVAEAHRLLGDRNTYVPLANDPSNDYLPELQSLIQTALSNGTIDQDMALHAVPTSFSPARFYLIPKVHKSGCPGRPVVSCSGSLSEKTSELVDFLIKPFLVNVPSYLRDTRDFLQKIRSNNSFPDNTLLASVDVVNLYPSIPHEDGLRALSKFLEHQGMLRTQIQDIVALARFVLTRNYFEFGPDFFLQISGTAIGTKMAPTYAIIFLHILETQFLASVPFKPFCWLRFIDDIFVIWNHGESEFLKFIDSINSAHPSISFTEVHSPEEVPFLDVLVKQSPSKEVITDLYTKPTDTHMYLHPASCHPGHVKRSIAYSQARRILSICSSHETALTRLDSLVQFLVRRGHAKTKVRREVDRAIRSVSPPSSLPPSPPLPVPVPEPPRVNFVLTYHPGLPNINEILRSQHHLLHLNPNLRTAIPLPPRLAFRKPPNLRNSLCRGRLPSVDLPPPRTTTCRPCSVKKAGMTLRGPRCNICPLLPEQNVIQSYSTNKFFKFKGSDSDCDSRLVVYCLTCTFCHLQYVGRSENFRLRVNNHKSCINLKRASEHGCSALYEHFSRADHSLDYVKFTILEVCETISDMKKAEVKWIWTMKTMQPAGLNIGDGFSTQPRR